jgi:hypothetical protein
LSNATCGAANDPVRILGKGESQDPEFQKEYLKLVDEESTSVKPDEIEKLIRGTSARYRNPIVALFKRISENV